MITPNSHMNPVYGIEEKQAVIDYINSDGWLMEFKKTRELLQKRSVPLAPGTRTQLKHFFPCYNKELTSGKNLMVKKKPKTSAFLHIEMNQCKKIENMIFPEMVCFLTFPLHLCVTGPHKAGVLPYKTSLARHMASCHGPTGSPCKFSPHQHSSRTAKSRISEPQTYLSVAAVKATTVHVKKPIYAPRKILKTTFSPRWSVTRIKTSPIVSQC